MYEEISLLHYGCVLLLLAKFCMVTAAIFNFSQKPSLE